MSYNEEQLYYTCMNFCSTFFRYMMKKNEYETAKRLFSIDSIDERESRMRYERRRLQDAFDNLKEAINKVGEE